jgi:hypothetical protein
LGLSTIQKEKGLTRIQQFLHSTHLYFKGKTFVFDDKFLYWLTGN